MLVLSWSAVARAEWLFDIDAGARYATHKTIDVSRDRRVEAAWTVKLKREVRVRRAPISERGGTKY